MTATSTPASDPLAFLTPSFAPPPAAAGASAPTGAPEFATLLDQCAEPPGEADFYAALSAGSAPPAPGTELTEPPAHAGTETATAVGHDASATLGNRADETTGTETKTEAHSTNTEPTTEPPAASVKAPPARSARGAKSTAPSRPTTPTALFAAASRALTNLVAPESPTPDPSDPSDPSATAPAPPPLPTDDDAAAAALTAAILSAQFHLVALAPAAPVIIAGTPAPSAAATTTARATAAMQSAPTPTKAPPAITPETVLPPQRAEIPKQPNNLTAPILPAPTTPAETTAVPIAHTPASSNTPLNTQFRAPAAAFRTVAPPVAFATPIANTAPASAPPFAPAVEAALTNPPAALQAWTTPASTLAQVPVSSETIPAFQGTELERGEITLAPPPNLIPLAPAMAVSEVGLSEFTATAPAPDTSITTQFRAPAVAAPPVSSATTTTVSPFATKPAVAVALTETSTSEATPTRPPLAVASENVPPLSRDEVATTPVPPPAPTARAREIPPTATPEHTTAPPASEAPSTPQLDAPTKPVTENPPAATITIPPADTKPSVVIVPAPIRASTPTPAPISIQPPPPLTPAPQPREAEILLPIPRTEIASSPAPDFTPTQPALELPATANTEHTLTPSAPAAAVGLHSTAATTALPSFDTKPSVVIVPAPIRASTPTPAPQPREAKILSPIPRAEIASSPAPDFTPTKPALELPATANTEHTLTPSAPAAAGGTHSTAATSTLSPAATKPSAAVSLPETRAIETTPGQPSTALGTPPTPAPPTREPETDTPMQRAEIAVTPVSAAASTERARGLPATQTPRPNAIPSAATTPIPSAATEPVVAVPSRPTNATETAPPSRVSEKPLQVPPAETAPAPSAAPTKPALQNPVPSSRAEIATTPWPAASTVATPPAPRAENLVPTPTNPTPPTNPLAENSPAPIAPAAPTPTTPHGTAAPIGSSAIPNQTSSATPPPTAAPTPMPARNVLPNPPAPERAEIAKASATAVAPTTTTEAAPSTTKSTTAEPATKPAPSAARGEILPRQPARQQTPAPTPTAAPARLPAPAAAPARSSLPVFIPSAAAFLARAQSPAVPGPLLPVSNPRWLQTSAATASPILPATRNDLTITAPSATRANSQLPPPVASRVESLNAQTISPRTAPTIAAPAISAPAVAATPRLAPAPVIPPPGAAPFTTISNLTKTLAPLPFATRDAELIAVEWVDLEAAAGNEIMVGSTSAAVAFAADTATSTARPTGIAEFSSPPTVELSARPARNRNSDASRAPGATTPSGTGATIAGANSARSSSTTEQRVILEFRDPAGALFRIISEPETWLAVGSELLPGWRHANLAGADRQEIPTGTALPGNARPSTEAAGENPAGSENRGQRQFSPDARGEFAELSARPVNARGLETAVHPAFTGFGHVPLTNEPEPRLTNSLLKIASVEKTADAAVAHPGLGTTTAPQHSNMNTADAGNQSAPRPEKSLPLVLGFAGTPDSPALPGQWKIRRESRPFAAAALATDPALAPWTARATSDPRDLELAAAPPLPEPTRVPMEKVQTLISRELNLVRQLGADALAIVLKPDSRTELFLQISHHNGKTEALIRCERGDFEHLQKNWAQLQNTLAGQQVTLAPLQRPTLASQEITDRGGPSGTTSFSGNTDTGTGQHPQRQHEQAPRSLDELPLVGSLTEPFKRRSTNRVTTSTTAGATAIATNKTGLERWA